MDVNDRGVCRHCLAGIDFRALLPDARLLRPWIGAWGPPFLGLFFAPLCALEKEYRKGAHQSMSLLVNRYSVMTFYSDPTDPACHAVRFVLAEKDINVDVVQVQGDHRPEELNDLNPYGAVLTLVDRDLVLYEEQIIMEYLDERFPHPPLMPVDPVSRASNRLLRYRLKRDIYALVEVVEHEVGDAQRRGLRDHLTAIAPLFAHKPFFLSDEFSLVDCYLAPILWRLPKYGVQLPSQAKSLVQYGERVFQRASFQASLSEAEREMR